MNDTHPDIARAMIDGYRRMAPAQKLRRAGDLTASVRLLAAARIRRERPDASEREVIFRVAAMLYPRELMERVPESDPNWLQP